MSQLVTIQYEILPAASAVQHFISSYNHLCICLKKKSREIILVLILTSRYCYIEQKCVSCPWNIISLPVLFFIFLA